MINAYCDGGGNNRTKTGFYGSFLVGDNPDNAIRMKILPGVTTTNEAEYQTLYDLLMWLRINSLDNILIHTDSMLVCNQIKGSWKVKSETIRKYWLKVIRELSTFRNVKIIWVSRNVIVEKLGH